MEPVSILLRNKHQLSQRFTCLQDPMRLLILLLISVELMEAKLVLLELASFLRKNPNIQTKSLDMENQDSSSPKNDHQHKNNKLSRENLDFNIQTTREEVPIIFTSPIIHLSETNRPRVTDSNMTPETPLASSNPAPTSASLPPNSGSLKPNSANRSSDRPNTPTYRLPGELSTCNLRLLTAETRPCVQETKTCYSLLSGRCCCWRENWSARRST